MKYHDGVLVAPVLGHMPGQVIEYRRLPSIGFPRNGYELIELGDAAQPVIQQLEPGIDSHPAIVLVGAFKSQVEGAHGRAQVIAMLLFVDQVDL